MMLLACGPQPSSEPQADVGEVEKDEQAVPAAPEAPPIKTPLHTPPTGEKISAMAALKNFPFAEVLYPKANPPTKAKAYYLGRYTGNDSLQRAIRNEFSANEYDGVVREFTTSVRYQQFDPALLVDAISVHEILINKCLGLPETYADAAAKWLHDTMEASVQNISGKYVESFGDTQIVIGTTYDSDYKYTSYIRSRYVPDHSRGNFVNSCELVPENQ